MKIICALTGTPGTGKSSLGRALDGKKIFGYKIKVMDLNKEILENRLYSSYDKRRKTYVADLNKVTKFVKEKTRDDGIYIIESHLSHLLKINYDLFFLCRAGTEELHKRLAARGWSEEKIRENLESEVLEVIPSEIGGEAIQLDTSHGITEPLKRIIATLKEVVKEK